MNVDEVFPKFDSDAYPQKVVALNITGGDSDCESPRHQHRKGQLVLALHGHVKCKISNAIWMVPPNCAVWVPSQVLHINKISADANLCVLFIEPDVMNMPTESCTLSTTPLLRELIIRLASLSQNYQDNSPTSNIVNVLLHELTQMPTEQYDFPIPKEPRLNLLANELLLNPGDRSTIYQWGQRFAMSERTLSRLIKQHVGMTFGKWRTQLHIVISLQKLSSGVSVQLVSEELGYETVSSFINTFKKTLGRPPKQYIKNTQKRR